MNSYSYNQNNPEDDDDFEADSDYSHQDQSRISSLGSGGNSAEVDSSFDQRKELERQTAAMAEAQLALLQQRNIELKSGIVPIVVPAVTPLATFSTAPAVAPSVVSQGTYFIPQSSGSSNSSFFTSSTTPQATAPYNPPAQITVKEVIDPRYTIKQYTPKSIILRQTDALPPYFFKAYKNTLTGNPKMSGNYLANCRDGGREGYCYSLYKMKELQDMVLAIMAGIIKPDSGSSQNSSSSAVGSYFSGAPAPAVASGPIYQMIRFPLPSTGNLLNLIIENQKYPMQVVSTVSSKIGDENYVTEAVCRLADGNLVQIKLDATCKFQIPSFTTLHKIDY